MAKEAILASEVDISRFGEDIAVWEKDARLSDQDIPPWLEDAAWFEEAEEVRLRNIPPAAPRRASASPTDNCTFSRLKTENLCENPTGFV